MKDDRLISLNAAIKTAHLPVIDDAGYEVVRVDDILALPSVQLAQDLTKGCTDAVSRQGVLRLLNAVPSEEFATKAMLISGVNALPSTQPEIIHCKDCKHNPKLEWFGCPMASLSEKQRPETAWCWKGERKDGDRDEP